MVDDLSGSLAGTGRRCWSWKYFVGEADDRSKCMFCNYSYRNNTYKFKRHLLTQCAEIPDRYKEDIRNQNTKIDGYYAVKRAHCEPIAQTSSVSSRTSETNYLTPMAEDSQIHNILSFIDQNTVEKNGLQALLVKFIATSNASPEDLQNPYFRDFIQKLQPDFIFPSAEDFKQLVEQQHDHLQSQISSQIKEAKFLSLSVEETPEHLHISVHCPNPVYYERVTIGEQKPFALLDGVLNEVGVEKVVAIKHDNFKVSACLGRMENEFPWVILDGCMGCLIERAMDELVKIDLVQDLWTQCCFVVQFFRRPNITSKFSKLNKALLEIPLQPKTGSSTYRLLNAVHNLQSGLNEAIWWPKLQEEANIMELRQLVIENLTFWDVIRDLVALLKPFAEFTASAEADYSVMLKRMRKALEGGLEKANSFDANTNRIFQEIIQNYLEEATSEVSYVFDLLDHSTRGVGLSDDNMDMAINMITNKIMKNPNLKGDDATIIREIGEFRARTGAFDENRRSWLKSLNEESSQVFWSYFPNTKLATIANLLNYIPFARADCETCQKKPEESEDLKDKLLYLKHNLRQDEDTYPDDREASLSNRDTDSPKY